jgi:hypothetical protein
MERVHHDRGVRAVRVAHHLDGVGERADSGVDGELQPDPQAVPGRPVAEITEALEGAGLVRLGAHDQDMPRAQARRDFEKALRNAHRPVGLEAQKLRVEHGDPRVLEARERVPQQGPLAQDVIGRDAHARRSGEPDSDRAEARRRRHRHQLRRCRVQHGQVSEREPTRHGGDEEVSPAAARRYPARPGW